MINVASQAQTGHTPVSNRFIAAFLPQAPEGFVKVYLYGLWLSQTGACADMAGALGMAEQTVLEALRYWQGQGLVQIAPGDPPTVRYLGAAEAMPVVLPRARADFYKGVQAVFGSRVLSGTELGHICDLMDVYGLSEAAALMLCRHCVQHNERGNKVTAGYIEAVGRTWADKGILNAEAAEEYLRGYEQDKSGAVAVLKRLSKRRAPTADETALYEKWMEQGFDEETVLLACAELTASGTPSFKALDGVLQNCRRNGAVDAETLRAYMRAQEQARAFGEDLFTRMGVRRKPTLADIEQIEVWRSVWHMPADILRFAAERAFGEGQPMAACRKLVTDWHAKGVTRLLDAQADYESAKLAHKEKSRKSKAFNYLQRQDAAAESFAINLDD